MVKNIPQFGTKVLINKLHQVVSSVEEKINRLDQNNGELTKRLLSWKFPDQKASELDVSSILKKLQFHPKNEDANALCHLFLLEIIIDRTLYFMFLHLIKHSPDYVASVFNSKKVINTEPSSILELYVTVPVKQIDSPSSIKDASSSINLDPESLESKINRKLTEKSLNPTSVAYQTQNWLRNLSLKADKPSKKEVQDFQSQTTIVDAQLNSNLLPSLLIEISKTMEKLQLPSLVAKELTIWEESSFKDQLEIISGVKVDTSRITRLKDGLESKARKSEEQFGRLQSKAESLAGRIEEVRKKQQNLHIHFEKFTKSVKLSIEQIDRLFHDMANNQVLFTDELLKHKSQLELLNSQVTNFKKMPSITNSVVTENSSLSVIANAFLQNSNLKSQRVAELTNEVTKQSAELSSITKKLEVQKERFCEAAKDLNERTKECQKAEDELDRMKEELEDEKKRSQELSDKLKEINGISEKEEALRADLGRLKVELGAKDKLIEELKKNVSKLEDQCCLMAEYPDLNGPIEVTETSQEGDLKQEMQGQIKANELRIALLHKQTEKLKVAASKLE